ncbi:DUF3465 domain-containing protein [Moraxella nasovis]|uniref:DUF3465 domain-containing protein n=1 Tax=Moraxella nasovis TaxID=2904121 RepID=UPI001F61CE7F|nr:DUF3465 domain-containing protein [Moraxella nasovis]UNU73746.1 DUF3465 domain-containing protein [Moraxella nasovis]
MAALLNGCTSDDTNNQSGCQNDVAIHSFQNHHSNVQVLACGVVVAILKDDNRGSRHQRFIVQLSNSSQTVLVVHNVDVAHRVNGLNEGDFVALYGEYEYNDQGGVIHWTHRDVAGRHQDGYISHNGVRYY